MRSNFKAVNFKSFKVMVFAITLTSCHSRVANPVREPVSLRLHELQPTELCLKSQQNGDASFAHTIRVLSKVLSAEDCATMFESLTTTRHLDLSNRDIADIAPLRYASSLESLDLSQNLITDLSPVAGLSSLKRLYVSDNKLTALPSPNSWTAMLELNVASNYIADISALVSMVSLTSFDISGNRIRSAQPLRNARSLRVLYAAGNGIEDVTPIAAIVGLEQLNMANNSILDIRPLADLTALNQTNHLDLRENPISRSGCPVAGESLAVTSFCQSIFFDRN